MWKLYFFTAPPAIWLCLYLLASGVGDDMQTRDKVPVGTLASLSTESHWYGDTSRLVLESGTKILLSGSFNPWTPGEAVTQPVNRPDHDRLDAKQYWCVGQTCLLQK